MMPQQNTYQKKTCSPVQPILPPTYHPADETIVPAASQPTMHRHVRPSTAPGEGCCQTQNPALLRELKRQNELLTDLLAAVNGLTALLCSHPK